MDMSLAEEEVKRRIPSSLLAYAQALKEELETEEQEESINRPMTELKLIRGGKDDGLPPSSGNWLKDMAPGTVFFAQNRLDMKDFNLVLFRIEGKDGPHDKIICLRSPQLPKEIYVDPNRFTNIYSLHHSLGVVPAEVSNNDNNRTTPESIQTEEGMAGSLGTEEVIPKV